MFDADALAGKDDAEIDLLLIEADATAWRLVGVATGSVRVIGKPFQADLVIARENLATGLAGDAELPAGPRPRPTAGR